MNKTSELDLRLLFFALLRKLFLLLFSFLTCAEFSA